MRILALVPGGISDQLLFFPTLDALKNRYPDAQIDVVVETGSKDAYRVSKSVRDVIIFEFQGRNSLADWGNLLGVMRDREYEVALSLVNDWSTGLMLWLSGIPTRVGYSGGSGSGFFTAALPHQPKQYRAAEYHGLLQGLAIASPLPELAVKVSSRDLEWADGERQRLGLVSGGYVVIAGATDESQPAYPVNNWKQILEDFQKKQPDLALVVVRTLDAPFADHLLELLPTVKLSTPENLGQQVALLAGASLVLCCNGVTMHLAIATQAFTLALFGQEDPKQLLPSGDRILGLKSSTGTFADIAPSTVLEKVWGG
ncbi:MAG: glycosyltransferase family 9 protein [Synechococcales bacterium]|nr:glycosyltransferase family 9 protein [Synechococcales bacterium]